MNIDYVYLDLRKESSKKWKHATITSGFVNPSNMARTWGCVQLGLSNVVTTPNSWDMTPTTMVVYQLMTASALPSI